MRFKALTQEINFVNGDEYNRKEISSEPDDGKQVIKYESEGRCGYFRFNVNLL